MKKNQNKTNFNSIENTNNSFPGLMLRLFNSKNDRLLFGSYHYSNLYQENLQIIYANIRV